MSTKLLMRIVVTMAPPKSSEIVASELVLNCFAPDVLDREIDALIDGAKHTLSTSGLTDPKQYELELSMQLSSEGDGVRPALHISRTVLEKLASIGAALDFDPYCE